MTEEPKSCGKIKATPADRTETRPLPAPAAAAAGNARNAVANPLHFSPRLPGAQPDGSGADAPEGRF